MKLLKTVLHKKRVLLLALYVIFIVYITLLSREPGDFREYNFQLFWSYQYFFDKAQPQGQQIMGNILFFIPYGAFTFAAANRLNFKKRCMIAIVSACVLSMGIETLQFIFKLGFAELDDVFDNTLGAAIGALFMLWFMKPKRKN